MVFLVGAIRKCLFDNALDNVYYEDTLDNIYFDNAITCACKEANFFRFIG